MKQGAIIEIAYDFQEWYPGLLRLMCGELETFGFVWGSLAVVLADLSRPLGLSPGPLRLVLSREMVASFPTLTLEKSYSVAGACRGRILHPRDGGRLARSPPLSGRESRSTFSRGSSRSVSRSF
jgi:hypothetical protein